MICSCCGTDKPFSEFYKDKTLKSGHMSKCKDCIKKQVGKRYAEKRESILIYYRNYHIGYRDKQNKKYSDYRKKIQCLKTPCAKCGENRLYVIDFHHIDPAEKSFNINRKTSIKDFSIIEDEVAKCISLCRNCHAEFHYLYGTNPDNPVKALEEYLGKPIVKRRLS